jgi:hypothetical protein
VAALLACGALLTLAALSGRARAAEGVLWTQQQGTLSEDYAFGVAVLGGFVYVTGSTNGDLNGQTSAGSSDVFIVKYSLDGVTEWTRLLGTASAERPSRIVGVELSATSQAVFVAGFTWGNLGGQPNHGGYDAFLSRVEPNSTVVWTRLVGSSAWDFGTGLDVRGGAAYLCGVTLGNFSGAGANAGGRDVFLSRLDALDAGGVVSWTVLLGSSADEFATGVVASADAVYVTGYTAGSLEGFTNAGGFDMFLARFTLSGARLWVAMQGSVGDDFARAVTLLNDGVFVAGYADGPLGDQHYAGNYDVFVTRVATDGSLVWTRLFGDSSTDEALDIASSSDALYVAGVSFGSPDGERNSGNGDILMIRLAPDGGREWTRLHGNDTTETATAITEFGGFLYVVGFTYGSLGGVASAGGADLVTLKVCPNTCRAGTFGICSPSCSPCPAGSFSSRTGMMTSDACAPCPAGSFAANQGSANCTLCPAGTFSSSTAQSSADTCQPCVVGRFLNFSGGTAASDCILCPPGRFASSAVAGQISIESCSLCPQGTFLTLGGQTSAAACVPCAAGRFSAQVGLGTDTCVECVPGRFSNITGQSNNATCLPCPPGRFAETAGRTSAARCDLCVAGRYSTEGGRSSATTCRECFAGRYSVLAGQSELASCLPCPPGTHSNITGLNTSALCEPCPTGRYSALDAQTSASACKNCPSGLPNLPTGAFDCVKESRVLETDQSRTFLALGVTMPFMLLLIAGVFCFVRYRFYVSGAASNQNPYEDPSKPGRTESGAVDGDADGSHDGEDGGADGGEMEMANRA